VSSSVSSFDSEEESNSVNGLSNGVKHVTLNGMPEVNGTEATEDVKEPDQEKYPPGMKSGLKHLYSGKEDKKGRFQWQDKIPEDIGEAAENDETAKWALLVRNVKVYNDPRRVLSIHSIVVQSPLLKKLLASVLKGYPGITVGLNRLEFSGKFEPLIHRWTELEAAIAKLGDETEDQRTTKAHAELLQEVLVKEFKNMIDTAQDMKSKRVMTYEHLWTLFQPGATVFARQDGQETAMNLVETRYGQDAKGVPCFWLTCKYVDWDGAKFGTQKINLSISLYTGTRSISALRVYPIEYHHDPEAIRERLIARGAKAEELAGPNYRAYQGVAWRQGTFGTKDKYNVKGRVSHPVSSSTGILVEPRCVQQTFEPSIAIHRTRRGHTGLYDHQSLLLSLAFRNMASDEDGMQSLTHLSRSSSTPMVGTVSTRLTPYSLLLSTRRRPHCQGLGRGLTGYYLMISSTKMMRSAPKRTTTTRMILACPSTALSPTKKMPQSTSRSPRSKSSSARLCCAGTVLRTSSG
tara:strand:+ start:7310 stop:8866 length:1557 start_codon:yes stop_codon:yes gene_type:complete